MRIQNMCPNLIFKLVLRCCQVFRSISCWTSKAVKSNLPEKKEQNLVFFSGKWSNLYMEWAAPTTHPQEPGVLPESLRWWRTLGHYGRYCVCLLPWETQSCQISKFMEATLKHQNAKHQWSPPPHPLSHAAPSTCMHKLPNKQVLQPQETANSAQIFSMQCRTHEIFRFLVVINVI